MTDDLNKNERILESMGLSKNEAKVYLTLIEQGPSSAVRIANKSKVHRTNVYETAERLVKKGYVKFAIIENTRVYEASPPERILSDFKQKEKEYHDILPRLSLKYYEASYKSQAHIHRSQASKRTMLNSTLKIKQPILKYDITLDLPKSLGQWLTKYHQERIRNKIPLTILYKSDAAERKDTIKQMKYTEARILPEQWRSPASVLICGNNVWVGYWKEDPLIIHIEDKDITEGYKHHFYQLWNLSK